MKRKLLAVCIFTLSPLFSVQLFGQTNHKSLKEMISFLNKDFAAVSTYLRNDGFANPRLHERYPCIVYTKEGEGYDFECEVCEKESKVVLITYNEKYKAYRSFIQELQEIGFTSIKTDQEEGKWPQQVYVDRQNKYRVRLEWSEESDEMYIDVLTQESLNH